MFIGCKLENFYYQIDKKKEKDLVREETPF